MRLRVETSGKAGGRNTVASWVQAVRAQFVPPSFIPVTLAAAIAWGGPKDIPPLASINSSAPTVLTINAA